MMEAPDPEVSKVLQNLLNLCYVRRWVIAPMARDQSVAEHTFRVMVLVRLLYAHLDGEVFNLVAALMRAMDHDNEEAITGDTPGPYKDMMGKEWPHPSTMGKSDVAFKVADALETYDWWMSWGPTSSLWMSPMSPKAGPQNRDILKVRWYCQDWPELLESVKTIMAVNLGYDADLVERVME